ncbi:MAG: RNA pyrophosphohydrolase [candidate division WS6 bacterium OLB20]|uniref:RNA pyrophosphohydrolase n=1 Tax=candidate division WS6 bacterium OLB20 TaxID=1617426 RepID=A0A136LVR2_9BACT|nr:MAG: RNA pyrophosphohydrolase [candidate division WS6 bacterium OLB20]
MKILTTISDHDSADYSGFVYRAAARGAFFNEAGLMPLLHVGASDYYKLPGGGIEPGESMDDALSREVLEETGCELAETILLGMIIEVRSEFRMVQVSFCYTGKIATQNAQPEFTADEQENGFELMWTGADEALQLLAQSSTKDYESDFITRRDASIIREAGNVLS